MLVVGIVIGVILLGVLIFFKLIWPLISGIKDGVQKLTKKSLSEESDKKMDVLKEQKYGEIVAKANEECDTLSPNTKAVIEHFSVIKRIDGMGESYAAWTEISETMMHYEGDFLNKRADSNILFDFLNSSGKPLSARELIVLSAICYWTRCDRTQHKEEYFQALKQRDFLFAKGSMGQYINRAHFSSNLDFYEDLAFDCQWAVFDVGYCENLEKIVRQVLKITKGNSDYEQKYVKKLVNVFEELKDSGELDKRIADSEKAEQEKKQQELEDKMKKAAALASVDHSLCARCAKNGPINPCKFRIDGTGKCIFKPRTTYFGPK